MPTKTGVGFGGALTRFDFKPSIGITAARVDKLGADIRSFREPLKRSIQQVVAPSIRENFDVGGRPAWEGLSDYAIARHEKEGGTGEPLVKKGTLRKKAGQLNIWTITKETATIQKFPLWYGYLHQAGYDSLLAAKIPQRRFIMLQPEDIPEIDRVFEEWLDERISAHF